MTELLEKCLDCGSLDVQPAKLEKYKGRCLPCKKKIWQSENSEVRKIYSKTYRKNNPKKVSEGKKRSRNKKIDKYKDRATKYYKKNKLRLDKENMERYHKNSKNILERERLNRLETRSRDTTYPKLPAWDTEKMKEYNAKNSEKIKAGRRVNLDIKWGSVIKPEYCPKCDEKVPSRQMYVQIDDNFDFVGFLCSFCNGEKNMRKRI